MKKCTKCNKNKELSEFYRKNKGKYYCSICKECDKEKCRKYRAKTNYPELRRKQYLKNKNRENYLSKKWDKDNRKRKNALCAKYRAKKLNATPKWLTEDHLNEIKQIYKDCPKGYHVDHIVPLQGKNVSGLHVPWNLRIVTAEENLSKGNKLDV